MSRTYPTPISGILPLHPPRPGVARRLARWACRPLDRWVYLPFKLWLRDREIIALYADAIDDSQRERGYRQAGHWGASKQIRARIDATLTMIGRLERERDELTNT
ncbi:MAG: hypothetical protein JWQ89_4576 [Devosia sp.]|uniref:hypothetical protein n=1 Tax=Devosia sp. TaxID=1871048 RepID=UPI0026041608|nr:hypothetical protein [Devosia sp.]MDB5542849.1 hypothetical protein [Devosia sp.]